jgi:hypothetical protein
MMTAQTQSLLQQSDALYERYGKPLEKTHRGKFIAISLAGKTLIFCDNPTFQRIHWIK